MQCNKNSNQNGLDYNAVVLTTKLLFYKLDGGWKEHVFR